MAEAAATENTLIDVVEKLKISNELLDNASIDLSPIHTSLTAASLLTTI